MVTKLKARTILLKQFRDDMRSNFSIVEKNHEHKLVYIRDNSNGGMTVTNDAENVLAYFQKTLGLDWTVIY